MSLCLTLGGARAAALAGELFTLSWIHSVERTEWREVWRLEPAGLMLVEARVKGSGAGVDPGEGARLADGWWIWTPSLPPQPALTLAVSGATPSGWRLCAQGGACLVFGEQAEEQAILSPCKGLFSP